MRINISLKWFISIAFLAIGILLVVGYTRLSGYYFILGMDNIIAANMEQTAQEYQPQTSSVSITNDFVVSRHWQQQPPDVQKAFPQVPTESGKLLKQVEHAESGGPPKNIIFVMRYEQEQGHVYISRRMSRQSITSMVDNNVKQSRNTLFTISALILLALALVLALLFWLVSRPINALGDWTRSLDVDQLKAPAPDFYYPELNNMAALIKTSLNSVQTSLEREQQFLQHASHELRTPISVIRNNIELLHRLKDANASSSQLKQQAVIDRIDRASLTMQHLTEALLWLSKESPEELLATNIQLDVLLNTLVEEMRYLLNDKQVRIVIDTEVYEALLPETAVKIVLGNLIRNSFQHTWEGEIVIRQQANSVEIVNTNVSKTIIEDHLGFGLGLKLTRQLANRLGWDYWQQDSSTGNTYKAKITF